MKQSIECSRLYLWSSQENILFRFILFKKIIEKLYNIVLHKIQTLNSEIQNRALIPINVLVLHFNIRNRAIFRTEKIFFALKHVLKLLIGFFYYSPSIRACTFTFIRLCVQICFRSVFFRSFSLTYINITVLLKSYHTSSIKHCGSSSDMKTRASIFEE